MILYIKKYWTYLVAGLGVIFAVLFAKKKVSITQNDDQQKQIEELERIKEKEERALEESENHLKKKLDDIHAESDKQREILVDKNKKTN